MRKLRSVLAPQLLAALALSAAAIAATVVQSGQAGAADLTVYPDERPVIQACAGPREVVILYDEQGRPTVPGRTEYYYCVTGTVLRPGDIPPPPEYCCG